jgi:hypothetical protein
MFADIAAEINPQIKRPERKSPTPWKMVVYGTGAAFIGFGAQAIDHFIGTIPQANAQGLLEDQKCLYVPRSSTTYQVVPGNELQENESLARQLRDYANENAAQSERARLCNLSGVGVGSSTPRSNSYTTIEVTFSSEEIERQRLEKARIREEKLAQLNQKYLDIEKELYKGLIIFLGPLSPCFFFMDIQMEK